jgi:hypothetical protein
MKTFDVPRSHSACDGEQRLGRRRTARLALIAGATLVLSALTTGPAAAAPQFWSGNFACEGQSGYLMYGSFDPGVTDVPMWATWGTPNFTGYTGDAYATTRIKVVDSETTQQGHKVVTCRMAYTGEVVNIVLLSPVPSPPPHEVSQYATPVSPAEPGRYHKWVVRTSGISDCFAASPYGVYDYSIVRTFCLDVTPELWDIVNIDYQPLGTSRLTVRGTLTSLK